MPGVRVARRPRLSAAHRLRRPALSAEENRRVYCPCNRPSGRVHGSELDVTVEGEVDPRPGCVPDLHALRAVAEEGARALDHRNLNRDVPWLEEVIPSSENRVVAI